MIIVTGFTLNTVQSESNGEVTSSTNPAVGKKLGDIFPDEIFQKVIIEKLKTPGVEDDISIDTILTESHLEKVTSISVTGTDKPASNNPQKTDLYEIESVEGIQYFTNLTHVYIVGTNMRIFPTQVFKNTKLQVLNISYNYFMDMRVEDKFDSFPNLIQLNFDHNGRNREPNNPFIYPKSLNDLKKLQSVYFINTGKYSTGLETIPGQNNPGVFYYYNGDLEALPANVMETSKTELNFGYNKLTTLSLDEYNYFMEKDKTGKFKISYQYVIKNVDYDILGNNQILSDGSIFSTIDEVMRNQDVELTVSIVGYGNEKFIDYSDIYDEETGNIYIPLILENNPELITDRQLSLYIRIAKKGADGKDNGALQGSVFQFVLNTKPVTRNVIYKDINSNLDLGTNSFTQLPGKTVKHDFPSFEGYSLVDDVLVLDIPFTTDEDIIVYYQKEYTVTVNYEDEEGNIVSDSITLDGVTGDEFLLDIPSIPGLEPLPEFLDYKVTIEDGNITITVVYKQETVKPEEIPIGKPEDLPGGTPGEEPEELPDLGGKPNDEANTDQKPNTENGNVLPSTGIDRNNTLGLSFVLVGILFLCLRMTTYGKLD